jgi:opacity protein-like surface antigen
MNSHALVGGVLVAASTLACVFSAQAADLPAAPRPAPLSPVAYAPPVYNWSGFYVGGHIGGGFADSSWSDPFTAGSNNFHKGGFLGGGQVGFNTQFNWLVVGLEGDFGWTGIKSHSTDSISASGLWQRRSRHRACSKQLDRSRSEHVEHDIDADRLDRGRRPRIRAQSQLVGAR